MRLIHTFIIFSIGIFFTNCSNRAKSEKIDRFALVSRHNIEVRKPDTLASLSVGNGNFTFTTDITGLQTFYREYENGMPLGTMSNWGWHSNPNTEGYKREECDKYFGYQGRKVPYQHQLKEGRGEGASNYFRENPHRLHLGIIRLYITKENGDEIVLDDIVGPKHSLDMWTGQVKSEFTIEGEKVSVETYCHQHMDLISARVESGLVKKGRLKIEWYFPFGVAKNTHVGYDFSVPEKHKSMVAKNEKNRVEILRQLDTNRYYTTISWKNQGHFDEVEKHKFRLTPDASSNTVEFDCLFSENKEMSGLPGFSETKANNEETWKNFWLSGGAIDFSECTDPRARELERRTVLSQYLIQVQSSGDYPPAETGLTYNSWYGKFHLEMHWWHAVHFAYWNRSQYLEKQMPYYRGIREVSAEVAKRQGFEGLRWPKMVGLQGMNSPSSVGSYLVWQQPHYIYYAELLYRENPDKALKEYSDLVFETADFMFDYLVYNKEKDRYDMLPPLIPAQEHWSRETTTNPPFELSQFHWALSTAMQWKSRLGQEIPDIWKEKVAKLAQPVAVNGVYPGIEGANDAYTDPDKMRDHPMVLGAYGMMPYWMAIDTNVMRNTLDTILAKWDWPSTWGWDYPLVAMCAARLGMPEKAIGALLMDVQKNTYLVNGHNYQSERLRVYLPGNGGFLTTMALMCAGWDGCEEEMPGFPENGKWNVKWENLDPVF